jgi:hypothetical protein
VADWLTVVDLLGARRAGRLVVASHMADFHTTKYY